MALISNKVTTNATTPTLIRKADSNVIKLNLHNSSGSKIYIGSSTVSVDTGYHLSSAESLSIDLLPGNSIYGLSSSGNKDIAWMEQIF